MREKKKIFKENFNRAKSPGSLFQYSFHLISFPVFSVGFTFSFLFVSWRPPAGGSRIQPTSILRGSRGRGGPLRPFGQTALAGSCPNSPWLDRCMLLSLLRPCSLLLLTHRAGDQPPYFFLTFRYVAALYYNHFYSFSPLLFSL